MSARTRTHRPTTASPRYTKARGIGQDRTYFPHAKGPLGTYRGLPPITDDDTPPEETDDGVDR